MAKLIKANGAFITDAGLIAEIVHETKTRATVNVVDTFFPVHQKPNRTYQVNEERREYLHNHIVGQTRTFWKTGTRKNRQVGGSDRSPVVVDWDYTPQPAKENA